MSQYLILPTNKDLIHHGRLGQKWGTRNGPPYPLNAAGLRKFRENRKAKKVAKQEEASRKAQERRERAEAEHKAQKEKTLMGGSAAQVMKYQGEWTNAELKQIVDRLDYEEEITAKIPRKRTTKDKMEDLMSSVSSITNYGNKGADLYNMIARYYNASGAGKRNPMTYIPDKGKDYKEKPKKEQNQQESTKKKKNKNKTSSSKKDPNSKSYWEWDY